MGQLIEVGRASVHVTECDRMGHMNVRYYLFHSGVAADALCALAGLGPRQTRDKGLVWRARDNHVRFHKEFLPGAAYTLNTGVCEIGENAIRLYTELRHVGSDALGATVTATRVLTPGDKPDAAVTLPPEFRARLEPYRVEIPAQGRMRGIVREKMRALPSLADAAALGLATGYKGLVRQEHCDWSGFMRADSFIGRLSDGMPVIFAGEQSDAMKNRGGAVVEYFLDYRAYPREGDLIVVKSGIRELAEKGAHWAHWMFDAVSGAPILAAEALALSFDLKTRKAIAIPSEVRARMSERLIPAAPAAPAAPPAPSA